MSITSTHPLFAKLQRSIEQCRDSYEGEEEIKKKTTTYLPATSGQKADGQGISGTSGDADYSAYLMRAVYPGIYREAVEASIGRMHSKPANIELPASMEDMRNNATLLGESLQDFIRKVNFEQLITGRCGIMADIRKSKGGTVRPILLLYKGETIRNWDDTSELDEDVTVNFVVLDESTYALSDDLSWEYKNFYRVLSYVSDNNGVARMDINGSVYGTAVVESDSNVLGVDFIKPNITGKPLDEIPFVFVNSSDMSPDPDRPPLMDLSHSCLAIYRNEADYNYNLFMQGQDTLVRIGANDPEEVIRVGAGAKIDVPINGDAKYIGVNSQGLPEQRSNLENRYARALQRAGSFVDSSKARESGEALRLRMAGQSATLPQIAETGCAALERILKIVAKWLGANPDQVKVEPNLEFAKEEFNMESFVKLMQAKGMGAPISRETIHKYLVTQGLTALTYEEETAKIEADNPGVDVGGALGSVVNEANGVDPQGEQDDESESNSAE